MEGTSVPPSQQMEMENTRESLVQQKSLQQQQ